MRVTSEAQSINGTMGIERYFDITPDVNSGLNATMVFHYDESELNGLGENALTLYSSEDGINWVLRGGTVDALANTVTLSGIDSFSRWTLGPMPALAIDPEIIYAYYAYDVEPQTAYIYLGGPSAGDVNEINQSTVVINGTIIPTSVQIISDHPDFTGDVLEAAFIRSPFVVGYEPFYDLTMQTYTLSGELNDATPFSFSGTALFHGHLAGDLNMDNKINVGDLVFLVTYMFAQGPAPRLVNMVDINGDGINTIVDLIYLTDYLFRGGPKPVISE